MNHYIFECPACKVDQHYPSKLNKHLEKCETYPEWIKTYKPSEDVSCNHCDKKFTQQHNLDYHMENVCTQIRKN